MTATLIRLAGASIQCKGRYYGIIDPGYPPIKHPETCEGGCQGTGTVRPFAKLVGRCPCSCHQVEEGKVSTVLDILMSLDIRVARIRSWINKDGVRRKEWTLGLGQGRPKGEGATSFEALSQATLEACKAMGMKVPE